MEEKISLLERLVKDTNCEFISDLHNLKNWYEVKKALDSYETDQYNLDEWNQAISYIFKESTELKSTDEIVAFLENHIP